MFNGANKRDGERLMASKHGESAASSVFVVAMGLFVPGTVGPARAKWC